MISAESICHPAALVVLLLLLSPALCQGQISDNLLKNPSFEEGLSEAELPVGWSEYGGRDENRRIELVEPGHESEHAVLIADGDPALEVGIFQVVAIEPGLTYEASVMVKTIEGGSTAGSHLQLRFAPSGEYAQTGLKATGTEAFNRVSAIATAPPDTKSATIYLYTHRDPTPTFIVDSVSLVSGVEPPPPPPPPPPEPVVAQYDKLKDLHLITELVKGGQANVTIIAPVSGMYDEQASVIAQAIEKLTGAKAPIDTDASAAGAVPITGNLIVLGNRSTNETISELYNRYYTLLDLRYPGPEGHVVRTLHSPFGDGSNVVFVGGSDLAGVKAATEVFIGKLNEASAQQGALAIGRLAEIKLGEGIEVPRDVRELKIWEASKGYKSTGYFGWCSISKRMAAYYMTGDEFHAREALRLSFPDKQALKDITEIDGERIENKDDPLAGFYHYNAHMAILFWDLIEESPVFSDEERLKVTNAFARQLNHRKNEGIYRLTRPPAHVGSRHGQYSAISLFCLGRYFNAHYPSPVWEQCIKGAGLHFAPLKEHAWVSGESDNLFWYNTGTAPILSWMLLSGDRGPLESGSLQKLLLGQEMLISGRVPDWALNSAAMDYLHKAAYLTGDGRWIEYRNRTGVDLKVFRLGQSFWPDESLEPRLPEDLVGKWSINPLPPPMWEARRSGLPFEESFLFGSFRSAQEASGDFVLLDGFNGASRNPYHTFAILELRLDGATLLKGFRNQVLTRADGMVEPRVAMNAALRYRDVVGGTATAIGEVPNAAYCNWRRSLIQRVGRYALVVDDLAFRTDSDNIEVDLLWETPGPRWDAERNALSISATRLRGLPPGWVGFRALDATCVTEPAGEEFLGKLDSLGMMLLRATEPGQWIEMTFELPEAIEGEAQVDFLNYVDRGVVRLYLDGEAVGEEYDNYADSAVPGHLPLGHRRLEAGKHSLRAEVVRVHEGSEKAFVGMIGLSVKPEGALPAETATVHEIVPSHPVNCLRQGAVTTMQWFGGVKDGEHRIFFSLIGSSAPQLDERLGCFRVADNAAALSLPSPALAVVGDYGALSAELAVVAENHLYGHALTRAGLDAALVSADVPIDLDWDLATGRLAVVAGEDTNLGLGLADADGLTLDGAAAQLSRGADGPLTLTVPAGRHTIEGARLSDEATQDLSKGLAALLTQGQEQRAQQLAATAAQEPPSAPELPEAFAAEVGGAVRDLITIPDGDGWLICAAEGKSVHLLTPTGEQVGALEADDEIRMVRWWPEHELLLVGCKDEQVIAFDREGNRKWVFVSEMHPDVFAAAKQYWFKSAHPGIWGVDTGVFLEGKSQAFVGSACTLEFVDESGKLVHRMTQFWGDPAVFRIIDGPEGSLNLLAARRTNGTNRLGIINNETLDARQRGFYSVPAGHTMVSGWSAQNTHHIFYEDLDGDGVEEVVTDCNGTWNRITVYDGQGKALHDASFGPGERMQARNMRDLEVADLDGDGMKEIIAATAGGLVVALSHQCEKLWARRLDSPPNVIKALMPPGAATPWLVIGCDDGSVLVLDGAGDLVRTATVNGRPQQIAAFTTEAGPVVVLATSKGEVKGLQMQN